MELRQSNVDLVRHCWLDNRKQYRSPGCRNNLNRPSDRFNREHMKHESVMRYTGFAKYKRWQLHESIRNRLALVLRSYFRFCAIYLSQFVGYVRGKGVTMQYH